MARPADSPDLPAFSFLRHRGATDDDPRHKADQNPRHKMTVRFFHFHFASNTLNIMKPTHALLTQAEQAGHVLFSMQPLDPVA